MLVGRCAGFALLLLATLAGCGASLDLAGDKAPTATIHYTAVRSGQRKFADYGSINRSILSRP